MTKVQIALEDSIRDNSFKKIVSELSLVLWMDSTKNAFKETVPSARESVSITKQVFAERIDNYEKKIIPIIDDTIQKVNILSLSEASIRNLLEFRDLIKQETFELSNAIKSLESLLKIYDKLYYWAIKEL